MTFMSLLGNPGNTGCKVRGDAPHRVRPQDLAKPAIARELAKERVLAGSRERVPARLRERVDDALPQILWGKYFIEAQGYTVEHNILFQDNKSTILLATNSKFLSSKKTKHIKNRFFLIKDKIAQGDIEIQ